VLKSGAHLMASQPREKVEQLGTCQVQLGINFPLLKKQLRIKRKKKDPKRVSSLYPTPQRQRKPEGRQDVAIEYRGEKFAGYNKPKKTPGAKKSHAVLAKSGSKVKLIRFGQQGVKGSPDGSARNKAFKARHAKNIAKGKMSAAYWADKVKW
jgi:hypothetical protein